ncbi:hypothetical protein BN961_02521 [Afipia felis]|uniref:Uncharacterized protein n=1 Tax=Afipia felis TaxID=1035 RepID=A0A090MNW4_AFIFE|nr:hypothetical protein BN961_02521 [Afipia felis]
MKHSGLSLGYGRRMHPTFEPITGGLNAIHFNRRLIKKGMKQANRIGAAANTRDQRIRKTTFRFQHLRAGFSSNDALKISNHHGIWMRPSHSADAVKSILNISHPITQCLIHGVF